MKVALVADWIYGGGSEKVVEQFHLMYPEAPIYTSYCSDEWRKRLDNKVVTGYLQHPPFKQLRKFLPLLRQIWFKRLDLSDYDLVISMTGNGEAKFVSAPNGIHISYCYTPVHYYWRHYEEYIKNPGFRPKWLIRLGLKMLVKPLRSQDYRAAQKVDEFIAISSHIQKDIKKYYNRDSELIFPPVDTDKFKSASKNTKRSGFVTMGRQVPLKKTDLIIQACNKLGLPLTVIGRGPEHEYLKQIAGPTITFKTGVSDEQMPKELASAEAFIFASYEDFGIAPIEAMASGTPVLAYKAGGALDYVVPDKTGEFFNEQDLNSMTNALKKFKANKYKPIKVSDHARKFSTQNFILQCQKTVNNFLMTSKGEK